MYMSCLRRLPPVPRRKCLLCVALFSQECWQEFLEGGKVTLGNGVTCCEELLVFWNQFPNVRAFELGGVIKIKCAYRCNSSIFPTAADEELGAAGGVDP